MGLRAGLVVWRRHKCLVPTGIRALDPQTHSLVATLRWLLPASKPRKQRPSNIRRAQTFLHNTSLRRHVSESKPCCCRVYKIVQSDDGNMWLQDHTLRSESKHVAACRTKGSHIDFAKIKLSLAFGVWWTLSVFITYEERAISSGWNVNGRKWTNMISVYQDDETEKAQRDGLESSSRASNWWSRLSSPL